MNEESPRIKVAESPASQRLLRRRPKPWPWILLALSTTAVLVIAVIFHDRPTGKVAHEPAPQGEQSATSPSATPAADTNETSAEETSATETSLWASPTDSAPISLDYLPWGTQLILHVRPVELLDHPEGEKIAAALGPWFPAATAQLKAAAGASWEEIEQLTLAISTEADGQLRIALILQLVEALSMAELEAKLPDKEQFHAEAQPYYSDGSRACYLPAGAEGRLLIVCPHADVRELITNGPTPPPLARDLERLTERSDADRSASLFCSKKFLELHGEKFLHSAAGPLQNVLENLLGDRGSAVAVSCDWDESFYLELQTTPELAYPRQVVVSLEAAVEQLPARLEEQLLREPLPDYSRAVLGRFPAMLRQLRDYTRVQDDEGICTANCYLPVIAGHNLLMASELMLSHAAESSVGGDSERL